MSSAAEKVKVEEIDALAAALEHGSAPRVRITADTYRAEIGNDGNLRILSEKAELMKLVWPDCVVEEIGLARNISLLRKALGENAEDYIETVPRRGYRFTAGEDEVAGHLPNSNS